MVSSEMHEDAMLLFSSQERQNGSWRRVVNHRRESNSLQ